MEQPVGNIHLFDRCLNDGGYRRERKRAIFSHGCLSAKRMNARNDSLLLVDHVGDAVREHSVGRGEHVKRLSKQHDLSVRDCAVTKKALMDEAAGDAGLLVDRVFAEGLIRCVDVDLDVDKLESGIHFLVQKSEKGSDILGAFVASLDT